MVIRSIGANWLVCMVVFIALATPTLIGKVVIVWWLIACFAISGFEHSIANMFFIALTLFAQEGPQLTLRAAAKNLLVVTFGNIIGGSVIVGCGLYGLNMWGTQAPPPTPPGELQETQIHPGPAGERSTQLVRAVANELASILHNPTVGISSPSPPVPCLVHRGGGHRRGDHP
eukprot:gnl/Dysnectes_brevis/2352_a2776_849.p3 GENE.gnl/Dysnectes_brevis/2352_a2776_849~~gnl/Dysnectes_brevis/2352_a2776_849.p3  ORF type:complete len:173 (-),score=66.52 gnl/Dysnectes_brevis/2352_a2776_849:1408-1926(-)